MAVNSALNAREEAIQETLDQKYAAQRHRDRVIDYNIKLQKRQAIEAKHLAARQLKNTIRMTTNYTESSLRNELAMKQSSVLESRSRAVLSPCTTSKVLCGYNSLDLTCIDYSTRGNNTSNKICQYVKLLSLLLLLSSFI